MNLKPFRDYSEHDVINLFKLDRVGPKALAVKISNSGWKTDWTLPKIYSNLSAIPNTYSPRWAIYPEVTPCNSGDKVFGLTLYETRENNQFGYSLLYDKQRREEFQAVVSGQAVPIVRQGLFHIGPFPGTGTAGLGITAGAAVVVSTTGNLAVVPALVNTGTPSGYVGEVLGPRDADNYVLVAVNCYLSR